MRIRKRNGIYHVRYYIDGERVERSTHCTDRKAAEALARQWERDAADPDHAAQDAATVATALGLLLESRASEATAGRKSHDTVAFYRVKAGHVNRLLGLLPLRRIGARHADEYIETRRHEGASESTIHKELVTLRASLKLAKRRALWRGDPADVCPIGFAPQYKPRTRALSLAEVLALVRQLPDDRAAAVAFMVATGAEWGAITRAERADITHDCATVLVRGTKRPTRWRVVPIVTPLGRGLLAFVRAKAEGRTPLLFTPWGNARRDIHAACARARIAPRSPNDLRRTFATWLRVEGASTDLIAPAMGHRDSRMVERVYGRLSAADLGRLLASQLGIGAPPVPQIQAHSVDTVDNRQSVSPRDHSVSVPRDGIEPPTRGFSVLRPAIVSSGKRRRNCDAGARGAPPLPHGLATTKPGTRQR